MKIIIEFNTNNNALKNKEIVGEELTVLLRDVWKRVVVFFNHYPNIGQSTIEPLYDSNGNKVGLMTVEKE